MPSMKKLKLLELFLYGHIMNSKIWRSLFDEIKGDRFLMLLVILECDRFYDESIDDLGDRFLIDKYIGEIIYIFT